MTSQHADSPVLSNEIRQQFIGVLQSDKGQQLLIELVNWLAHAARGDYVEAGNDPGHSIQRLRATNEMMIVVGQQLLQLRGDRGAGYPHHVFLDVLLEQDGASSKAIAWAIDQSLKRVAADDE